MISNERVYNKSSKDAGKDISKVTYANVEEMRSRRVPPPTSPKPSIYSSRPISASTRSSSCSNQASSNFASVRQVASTHSGRKSTATTSSPHSGAPTTPTAPVYTGPMSSTPIINSTFPIDQNSTPIDIPAIGLPVSNIDVLESDRRSQAGSSISSLLSKNAEEEDILKYQYDHIKVTQI